MKKENLVPLLAGAAVALSIACGAQGVPVTSPENPFPILIQRNIIPARPEADGNDGPIDGNWDRTRTTCNSGKNRSNVNITDSSIAINNASGSLILTYTSGIQANIPVSFTYSSVGTNSSGGSTGKGVMAKVTGPIGVFDIKTGNPYTGTYTPPMIPTANFSYTKTGTTLTMDFDQDVFCKINDSDTAGASNATFIQNMVAN